MASDPKVRAKNRRTDLVKCFRVMLIHPLPGHIYEAALWQIRKYVAIFFFLIFSARKTFDSL